MNLWPGDLSKEKTPLYHMYEQADKLEKKYEIDIRGYLSDDGASMKFKMAQVAGEDVADLLEIELPSDYPCKVHFDGTIRRCKTEAELIRELAFVFNHAKTKMAIAKLLE